MKPYLFRRFRFLIPLAIVAFIGLFTYAVYALWNGVLIDVIGVKTITYWQALGILVLSKILFGGFPSGGRKFGRREQMMVKHWESMEPEQRQRMREEMRHRFGSWPRPWCGGREDENERSSQAQSESSRKSTQETQHPSAGAAKPEND